MKPLTQELLTEVRRLLASNGLPVDDLSDLDLTLFLVDTTDGNLDAVGGLERCGDVALLRSLATVPSKRGMGLARGIVGELEQLALSRGFEALYLLTETATAYFEALGYQVLERSEVPQSIRETRQFSSLCPDSATLLVKRIA